MLKPSVAIFAINFPPEPTGIAPYTGALTTGLRQLGHSVIALVSHPHYPEWAIRDGYGQWLRIDQIGDVQVRRHLHYVPQSPRGVRRLLSELSFGVRLVLARWGKPKVVVAVSPALFATALVVLRLRFIPHRPRLVVWVQDLYTLGLAETGEGRGVAGKLTRWVETHTLRAADRVVVIHTRFAEHVVHELGVDDTKVAVIRNWAHLPSFETIGSMEAKSALGWPSGVTLAVHTGNMGLKQGLENIVEAARVAEERGEPVHFLLVGDGGERRRLEELARGISNISIVGPLDNERYQMALSAADVLLVNERAGVSEMAVPSKLTSYFHAGRPVIAATDPDGITASEVNAAGAGIVVAADEPTSLLEAVLSISADGAAASTFGTNGRRYRDAVLDQRVALEQWHQLLGAIGVNIPASGCP